MESWVSQLVKTHGEMWRTSALLLMGFYSTRWCRWLTWACISFSAREGNKWEQTAIQPCVNNAVIYIYLEKRINWNLRSKKKSAERWAVFVENPASAAFVRWRTGWFACYEKQPSQTVQPKAVAAMLDKFAWAWSSLETQWPPKPTKSFQSKSKKILNPHLFFLSLSLLGMLSPLALFLSSIYSRKAIKIVPDTLHISFLFFSPFGAPVVQGRGGKKVKPRALPSQFLEREPKEAGNCCTIVLQ